MKGVLPADLAPASHQEDSIDVVDLQPCLPGRDRLNLIVEWFCVELNHWQGVAYRRKIIHVKY